MEDVEEGEGEKCPDHWETEVWEGDVVMKMWVRSVSADKEGDPGQEGPTAAKKVSGRAKTGGIKCTEKIALRRKGGGGGEYVEASGGNGTTSSRREDLKRNNRGIGVGALD